MTDAQKITMIQGLLGADAPETTVIQTYLSAAKYEILAWRYGGDSNAPTEVPAEYEMTQVYAVVAGYTHVGSEGQVYHAENGITRTFQHGDMLAYIRANVVAKVGVPQ